MAIREGKWDCQYCGTKRIGGGKETCPGCGRVRPLGTNFYLEVGAPIITSREKIARAKVGPDWYCEHCESANRADSLSCTQCGAQKGSSPSHRVRDYSMNEIPRSSEEAEELEDSVDFKENEDDFFQEKNGKNFGKLFDDFFSDSDDNDWNKSEVTYKKTSSEFSLTILSVRATFVSLIMLIVGILIFMNFATQDVEITAKSHNWSRTISIEHYIEVYEEGWSLPSGAYNVRQEEKVHHYEKVQVGTETKERQESYQEQVGTETVVVGQRDLGNGYFEDITETRPVYETRYRTVTEEVPVYEDEPVYQTYYRYNIMRWVHARNHNSSNVDKKPFWPEYTLAKNERVSGQKEEYTVVFFDHEGKKFTKTFSLNRWLKIEPGQKFIGKVNYFGRLREIEGL